MASASFELDLSVLKLQRAASRRKQLSIKREEYDQRHRARSAAPALAGVKPHRIARAAARSCVAKGLIETDADMPSIVSLGRSGSCSAHQQNRKPSVAAVTNFTKADVRFGQLLAGIDAWEKPGDLAPDSFDLETTASECEPSAESDLSSGEGQDGPNALEALAVDMQNREPEPAAPPSSDMGVAADRPAPQAPKADAAEAPTHREKILREVTKKLHAMTAEERSRAQEAEAAKAALEEQLKDIEAKSVRKPAAAERRDALKLEKQRAAEMRKRRNQEEHLRVQKEMADRKMEEAKKMIEQAEADAIAAKAQKLAEADTEARQAAYAFVLDEVTKARGEMEELAQRRLEEVDKMEADLTAKARAEAAAIKAEAESKMATAKAKVDQAQAQAQLEAETIRRRAAVEARVIKGRAELEVRDLKSRAEAEQRVQQEAEALARVLAEEQAQSEQVAKAQAEAAAQRRAAEEAQRQASAAVKREKELERQRAKHFRKQAEQERKEEQRRQQELEQAQAQAAEEAAALRRTALEEAAALREKARAEAAALHAQAAAEAQARAREAAEATQRTAEAQAAAIRAEAETEAQRLREQLAEERTRVEAEIEEAQRLATEASSPSASPPPYRPADPVDGPWEMLLDDGSAVQATVAPPADLGREEDGWNLLA